MEKLKSLTGPLYDIENKHNFKEIEARVERLKKLEGPIIAAVRKIFFRTLENLLCPLYCLFNIQFLFPKRLRVDVVERKYLTSSI